MSGGVKVKFKGLNAFILGVEKQPAKVKQEVGNIIYETALRVEKSAKKRAPVDTGFLRDNIAASKVDALTSRIDSFAPYSVYLEKGTRFMDAQPFFQPAINMEIVTMYQNIKKVIKEGG